MVPRSKRGIPTAMRTGLTSRGGVGGISARMRGMYTTRGPIGVTPETALDMLSTINLQTRQTAATRKHHLDPLSLHLLWYAYIKKYIKCKGTMSQHGSRAISVINTTSVKRELKS